MNPERTIGETLRLAREEKGLTLEQVRDATRISLSVLRDLERDRFSELPGPIYIRNTIRVLAELLEQDRESLLERYQEAVSGAKPAPEREAVWSEEKVREVRLRAWRPSRRFLAVLIALAAVVLIIIWAPWRYLPGGSSEKPGDLASPVGGGLVEARLPDAGIPSLPEGFVAPEAHRPEEVSRLRIEAAGEARVLVNVDDRRNIFREFDESGGVWTLEGEEFFYLSAMNVDRLSLSLDGVAQVLPNTPGGEISGWRVDALGAATP